jgi:hypothetical protein
MSKVSRWVAVLAITTATLALPVVALAQEGSGEAPSQLGQISEQPGDPTIPEPAVFVVDEPDIDDGSAGTFIYLAPAALVIGAGAVLVTIVMYFLKVTRARYRVER